MKVFAVTSINTDRPPPGYRGSWAYRDFFHGESEVALLRYGGRPYKAVRLIRNAALTPPIFIPTIYMVVAPDVRRGLSQFPHVDFAPCQWHRVWDWPVDEAGVRALESRFSEVTEDFGEWMRARLREPTEAELLAGYTAVVAPLLERVAKSEEFADRCRPQFRVPDLIGQRLGPVVTCAAVHRKYPVIDSARYYLFTEPAFRVIEPHVADPYMFRVYEREVLD